MQHNLNKLKYFVEKIHLAAFYQVRPAWLGQGPVLDLYSPHLNKAYIISDDTQDPRIELCHKNGVKVVMVPPDLVVLGA